MTPILVSGVARTERGLPARVAGVYARRLANARTRIGTTPIDAPPALVTSTTDETGAVTLTLDAADGTGSVWSILVGTGAAGERGETITAILTANDVGGVTLDELRLRAAGAEEKVDERAQLVAQLAPPPAVSKRQVRRRQGFPGATLRLVGPGGGLLYWRPTAEGSISGGDDGVFAFAAAPRDDGEEPGFWVRDVAGDEWEAPWWDSLQDAVRDMVNTRRPKEVKFSDKVVVTDTLHVGDGELGPEGAGFSTVHLTGRSTEGGGGGAEIRGWTGDTLATGEATFKDRPVVNFAGLRRSVAKGFTVSAAYDSGQRRHTRSPHRADWVDPGVAAGFSNGRYSAYHATMVDAYAEDDPTDEYPGETFYPDRARYGSRKTSGLRLEEVWSENAMGGLVFQPVIEGDASTDTILVEGGGSRRCASGVVTTGIQRKAITLRRYYMAECHVAIDCLSYGQGQGTTPTTEDLNVGSIVYLLLTHGASGGRIGVGHAEGISSLGAVGMSNTARKAGIEIEARHFGIDRRNQDEDDDVPRMSYVLCAGTDVTFRGGFWPLTERDALPGESAEQGNGIFSVPGTKQWQHRRVVLDSMVISRSFTERPLICVSDRDRATTSYVVQNCVWVGTPILFNTVERVSTFTPGERVLVAPTLEQIYDRTAETIYNVRYDGDEDAACGVSKSLPVTNWSWGDGYTGSFETTTPHRLRAEDILLGPPLLPTPETPGTPDRVPALLVTGIIGNVVSFRCLQDDLDMSAPLTSVRWCPEFWVNPDPVPETVSWAALSTAITGVRAYGTPAVPRTPWEPGDLVLSRAAGLASNTRVASLTYVPHPVDPTGTLGTYTITLNQATTNNAAADVAIYSVRLEAEVKPSPSSPVRLVTKTGGAVTVAASDFTVGQQTLLTLDHWTRQSLALPSPASLGLGAGEPMTFTQAGAGQVVLAPAGGVTLQARGGVATAEQWDSVELVSIDDTTWRALDPLAATLPVPLPLDALTDAPTGNTPRAGFSPSQLRAGHSGPTIRLRRAGDLLEADFTAAEVEGSVVTAWIAAGPSPGTLPGVLVLYNQISGGGTNWTPTSAALPVLKDAGTARPFVEFDKTQYGNAALPAITTGGRALYAAVRIHTTPTAAERPVGVDTSAAWQVDTSTTGWRYRSAANNTVVGTNYALAAVLAVSAAPGATTRDVRVRQAAFDSGPVAVAGSGTLTNGGLWLGGGPTGATLSNAEVRAVVDYGELHDADHVQAVTDALAELWL